MRRMPSPTDDELKAALKAFDLRAIAPWFPEDEAVDAVGYGKPGPDGSYEVVALKITGGKMLKRRIGTVERTDGKIEPFTTLTA